MQTVLLVVNLLTAVFLVIVILLQKSEGGALGLGQSANPMMTSRGAANALTRMTALLAAVFIIASIGLALMARYHSLQPSLMETLPGDSSAPPFLDLPPQSPDS